MKKKQNTSIQKTLSGENVNIQMVEIKQNVTFTIEYTLTTIIQKLLKIAILDVNLQVCYYITN